MVCKSFVHVCADVPKYLTIPSISDALLATSYPNSQIEFRPVAHVASILQAPTAPLGRCSLSKCVTHVERVGNV